MIRLETIYRVFVVTSANRYARTNANVFIQLHGTMRISERLELRQSNNTKPFRNGQTDVFDLKMFNIGNLNNVTLKIDGQNNDDGWQLAYIVIHDMSMNKSWRCACDCWFDKDHNRDSRTIACKRGIEFTNLIILV